jgi:hypothetical protein
MDVLIGGRVSEPRGTLSIRAVRKGVAQRTLLNSP